jgi:hypothetical protein
MRTLRVKGDERAGSMARNIDWLVDQRMGGGVSGGSAAHAREVWDAAIEVDDVATTPGHVSAESAPSAATQALRHEAALSTPSGQHGQGSPSAVADIKSSQGIPDMPAGSAALVTAATTGAERST